MWGNKKKTALLLIIMSVTGLFVGCDSSVTSNGDTAVTETATSVSILQMAGFVSIERENGLNEVCLYEAREGIRLHDLDIVRTGEGAFVWLSLDDDKALQLGENSALRVDRQGTGFELTLTEGEIVAYTDQISNEGEDLAFAGATMSMGVRGQTELFDGLLTLNYDIPPSVKDFNGWNEFAWENYRYAGEWLDGAPYGEGTVYITNADGEVTLTGNLVDGFFHGPTARTITLDNGIVLNDELDLNMGWWANSSRQVYGMPPWTSGGTP
jgi:hypothetical protein